MSAPVKLVAIHQPNFFPWLGFFNKIARSDCFILLDNVQLPKTGGSWVNRSKILAGPGKDKWLTLPVDRSYHGTRLITETQISMPAAERYRLADVVRFNYQKAPAFAEVYPVLEPLLKNPEMNLAEYNILAIITLAGRLGIPADRFVRSSTLPSAGEVSTERLVTLVREVGGNAYLYGAVAAATYQENERFEAAGIAPVAQNFSHPRYAQFNAPEFAAGMSLIDALMNLGFAGTQAILSGNTP